jgi:hypothetical protein
MTASKSSTIHAKARFRLDRQVKPALNQLEAGGNP